MGKLVVSELVTFDGVMEAPGEEQSLGEFGGWAAPYNAMQQAGDSTPTFDALLLGRRTYEDFSAIWPKQRDSPFSALLDKRRARCAGWGAGPFWGGRSRVPKKVEGKP
jgi:hypothetical protein